MLVVRPCFYHIAICDDDSRLAAEPNGVVITSDGEARKLMMARALYKTPPSCCRTDPPEALDLVWEYEVYRRFSHISGGRTSVSISHRLASCRFCDEILAASSSGAAIGSCWRRRQYARLWHAQAQHDTDAL